MTDGPIKLPSWAAALGARQTPESVSADSGPKNESSKLEPEAESRAAHVQNRELPIELDRGSDGVPVPEAANARVDRKAFLREGAGALRNLGTRVGAVALGRVTERVAPALIRPPGAIPEELFLTRCSRCTECVDACHQESILIAQGDKGLSVHTPYLDVMNHNPCFLCLDPPCIAVCPSGALLPTAARDFRLGAARILRDTCLAWNDEPCDRCIERCPYKGEAIFADEAGRPWVDADQCTGCGLCYAACPTRPVSLTIDPRSVVD